MADSADPVGLYTVATRDDDGDRSFVGRSLFHISVNGLYHSVGLREREERRMCLGVPGQVVERLGDQPHLAKVDVGGVKRNVNIGLVENDGVKPGDWVLIHMGIAMSIMDAEEARSTLEFLERLGQIDSTSAVF